MSDDEGVNSVAQAREQIQHTREELAETIGALTDKVDVKAQASKKAHQAADTLSGLANKAHDAAPSSVDTVIIHALVLRATIVVVCKLFS